MKLRPASSNERLIEPLEARIAPALTGVFAPAPVNTAILLDSDPNTTAPQGLTASEDSTFLIYIESGSALVFTKDLNFNNRVDFNEITGIAAGNNLSLISFVDIHGDIVTNLNADGTLTDSDNDAANGRDGRVLLDSKINKITLRSVTTADLQAGEPVSDRIALSSYSIFGNIYAGGGFGTADGNGGLIIDDLGRADQVNEFTGLTGFTVYQETPIQIGSIRVGTAASGQQFGFGASPAGGSGAGAAGTDVRGILQDFIESPNSAGASINGIHATRVGTFFNINTLQAGDGGFNGKGGDISNVQITGDFSGGYALIAGDGGNGPVGPAGGSIINYSDLGSIAGGRILLKTGDGGNGLLKRGGDAGSLTLDRTTSVNFAGHVEIQLGRGGDGVTGGGNGGSQPTGVFTTPETEVPTGLQIISSMHQPGDIYNQKATSDVSFTGTQPNPQTPLVLGNLGYHATRGFDFDLDGANDAVYSTDQSDQLVVVFGDGAGGLKSDGNYIYLNNLPNSLGITVGDFNGDGHPDIASASADLGYAGVAVFLSVYDSLTGELEGFRDPIYSALPSIGGLFLSGGGAVTIRPGQQTAAQIFDIASGDFDDDGTVDIGLVANTGLYILKGDAQFESNPNGGLPILKNTGYFYADVPSNGGFIPAAPQVNSQFSTLHASALADGGRDFLFAADEGEASGPNGVIFMMDYAGANYAGVRIQLGTVDTNRQYPTGANQNIANPAPNAIPRDFVLLDVNNDGNADLVALTVQPSAFLVTFNGNGLGGFIKTSNRETGGQNDGIYLGTGTRSPSDPGTGLDPTAIVGILATNSDANANGMANDIAVVVYSTQPAVIQIASFSFGPDTGTIPAAATDPNFLLATSTGVRVTPDPFLLVGDQSIRAFDTFVPDSNNPAVSTFTYLQAFRDDRRFDLLEIFPTIGTPRGFLASLEYNTLFITSGPGGDSTNGAGGSGGRLGSALRVDPTTGTPVGSLSFLFPVEPAYEGVVRATGGDGGNGFSAGGAGSTVSGFSVQYAGTGVLTGRALLFAGDGGDSTNGRAGSGGNLSSFSIASGVFFGAGDGGTGKFGGNGGAVLGNPGALVDVTVTPGTTVAAGGKGDIENTLTTAFVVQSGVGGSGLKGGGNGGVISGLTPRFLPIIGGAGGLLHYDAGDGGSSVGGTGGRGGSIIDSAPVSQDNNLSGDIFLRAGDGGGGKNGGAGGDIVTFQNSSAPDISPTSLTFLAGNGGAAIGGRGGAGGTISKVAVSGTGDGFQFYFDVSNPSLILDFNDAVLGGSTLTYSRVIAGNGGTSLGGAGGAGGSLNNVAATSISSPIAGIAGRGGDGLTGGGLGGSVVDGRFNAAGGIAKILVAAGDGGDAYGSAPSTGNPLAFGGANAKAGNGGSITNFIQNTGTEVYVDLIAGNGGNTPNSGSSLAATTRVGDGGSITNAQISGNIGRGARPADELVAIKSYNNIFTNETFAAFVAANISVDPGIGGSLPILNDMAGNVGIVVGARGRVQDNNIDGILDPSTSGRNGSLSNVSAQTIMSAVAGSVSRIASIRTLSNVDVTIPGGSFGSDKRVDYLGLVASGNGVAYRDSDSPAALDYLNADRTHSIVPTAGGILVDGAIFADTVRAPKSARDF